jgi:superfamily II DNA/RNA helicase
MRGKDVPKPCLAFDDVEWPSKIFAGIKRQGYTKPTPIQAAGWPIALSGRDMVGIAQTGSGKTMAYTLPAFVHIDGQDRERRNWGPMVLIMAPTRELAQQIQEVIDAFSVHSSVCIFGGASKGPQIGAIQRNKPMIVVATPGRLNDFIESGIISMSNISFLVLDEADRMLDMGFEPQIRQIVQQITSKDRVTQMWSATWPKEVKGLAEDFLKEYVQLNVGSLQLHANHNISQIVEVVDEMEKPAKLFGLLTEIHASAASAGDPGKENKTIIFAETKRKVDELTRSMRSSGWPAMCIHGDKSQQERDWVLREFKTGKSPILVATDVAARGLGEYYVMCCREIERASLMVVKRGGRKEGLTPILE